MSGVTASISVPGANNYDNSETLEINWDDFRDPPIANQKFALLSIVGPNCPQKASIYGVAVRGVAANQETLDLLRTKIYKSNPQFDIYQAEVGTMIPLDFSEDQIQDTQHAEERLDTLMGEMKANFERARDDFNRHKTLLKNSKKDPTDIQMLIDSVKKQRAELDEQEEFLKEQYEAAVIEVREFEEEEAAKRIKEAIDEEPKTESA